MMNKLVDIVSKNLGSSFDKRQADHKELQIIYTMFLSDNEVKSK